MSFYISSVFRWNCTESCTIFRGTVEYNFWICFLCNKQDVLLPLRILSGCRAALVVQRDMLYTRSLCRSLCRGPSPSSVPFWLRRRHLWQGKVLVSETCLYPCMHIYAHMHGCAHNVMVICYINIRWKRYLDGSNIQKICTPSLSVAMCFWMVIVLTCMFSNALALAIMLFNHIWDQY